MRRFIGEKESDRSIALKGPEARHASTVLRLKPGALVIAVCDGARYECRITESSSRMVRADIIKTLAPAPPPSARITLAQAPPKGNGMDEIVRMASELGAEAVIPLQTGRTAAKLADAEKGARLERWRNIADSAEKVAGGASPCKVLSPIDLERLAILEPFRLKVVFWEEASNPLKEVLNRAEKPESILVAIGPEGGFSREEVDVLTKGGFQTASLGGRILRAATAGVVAISSILHHYS